MITSSIIIFLLIALIVIYALGSMIITLDSSARHDYEDRDGISALDAEHLDYIKDLQALLNEK